MVSSHSNPNILFAVFLLALDELLEKKEEEKKYIYSDAKISVHTGLSVVQQCNPDAIVLAHENTMRRIGKGYVYCVPVL